MSDGIENIIQTSKYLDNINQLCHNKGITFEDRINVILDVCNNKDIQNKDISDYIKNILDNVCKEELIQKVFMEFGNKIIKKDLDQYYTPLTIGKLMCDLCNDNKDVIDPACGTGDLLIFYKKNNSINLWDISEQVISLTNTNYKFHNMISKTKVLDSIKNYDTENGSYDYVMLNPPFGQKTVISDQNILKNYELGIDKKKQEIGILFIERSMNLLKEGGVAFIIVPSGYLGNSNNNYTNLRKYLLRYRIISIIRLPSNTFSRSGTGVSTCILIINKTPQSNDYNIHIKDIENIGYVLNKRNTPFKYKKEGNNYIFDDVGKPILDNDLIELHSEIEYFCYKQRLHCLKNNSTRYSYEVVNTTEIKNNNYILDIGRYLNIYKKCVNEIKNSLGVVYLRDLIIDCDFKFKKDDSIEYNYLDIKEVSTPFYNGKKLYGYELPGRASYKLRKDDILVSKLKGKISFTIILTDESNLICTNGFIVLRPKDDYSKTLIFGNLFSKEFRIQHQSLTTGSIMETITEEDTKNILMTKDINIQKYNNVIDSMIIIKNELN